jgi:tRNA U54 and U55 pseudouridine synthase Pus10
MKDLTVTQFIDSVFKRFEGDDYYTFKKGCNFDGLTAKQKKYVLKELSENLHETLKDVSQQRKLA